MVMAALTAAVLCPAARAQPADADADADAAFAAGRTSLARAEAATEDSRRALRDAHRVRQALLARRAGRPVPAGTPAADTEALAAELERLQGEGAAQRAAAAQALDEARGHFARGLAARQPEWVRDPAPLRMDAANAAVMAHNARVRSVHPNMPPPPTAAQARSTGAPAMGLPIPAEQNAPPDLDIAAFQLSRDHRLFAHVEVHVDPDTARPDAGGAATAPHDHGGSAAVPLNHIHRWRLVLSDLQGRPVTGATIEVAGHMPGHVHGLPTQPRVVRELAPGVYLVDGLKFQMTGWWVMQFQLQPAGADAAPDNVAFNLVF